MKSQLSLAKILEMGANGAIILAAILFSVVLAKMYLGRTPEKRDQPSPPLVTQKLVQKGDVLNIPKVNWRNGQTLLLALSTSCRFCTDSAPFYRRIMKDHGDTRLVALFPQEDGEGERYLSNLGIKVDEVATSVIRGSWYFRNTDFDPGRHRRQSHQEVGRCSSADHGE